MDGWIDGWMDGWLDGWMDARTDPWVDQSISRELVSNFPTVGNMYNETRGTAATMFAKERLQERALRATPLSQVINSPKTQTSMSGAYPANIQPAIPAAPCARAPCRLSKKRTRLGMGSGIAAPNANQRQAKLPSRHDHQMRVTFESVAMLIVTSRA